jgi:hypothetical protein
MRSVLVALAVIASAVAVYVASSNLSAEGGSSRRFVQCIGHHPDAPDRPSARPAECL